MDRRGCRTPSILYSHDGPSGPVLRRNTLSRARSAAEEVPLRLVRQIGDGDDERAGPSKVSSLGIIPILWRRRRDSGSAAGLPTMRGQTGPPGTARLIVCPARRRGPQAHPISPRAPLPQGVGTSLGGLYSSWTDLRRGRRRLAGALPRPGRPRPLRRQPGHLRRPPRAGRGDRRYPARRRLAAVPHQ